MLTATLSLVLDMFSQHLGFLFGIAAYAFSEYSVFIAHMISQIPYATVTMDLGAYRVWVQIWLVMFLAIFSLFLSRSCRTR